MAINTEKDKPQNLLSKIFSDENAVTRGVKDLAILFYDAATAPVRLNVALVKAAAKTNLPGVTVPVAMIPAAVFLACTVPMGGAGIAVGYGIVSAATSVAGNIVAGIAADEGNARNVYSAIYPNTVKRVDANKQRKLAAG